MPPLLDADLFDAVQAKLAKADAERGHGGGRKPSGVHLLTKGLLKCSCNATMVPRTKNLKRGQIQFYECSASEAVGAECRQPAVGVARPSTGPC